MPGIVYDARKIKAYEGLLTRGVYADREESWLNTLWEGLVREEEMMEEFMFYLDHHTFLDAYKCGNFSMTDLYVWQINRYNLIGDTGKNTSVCNKEEMALKAFWAMLEMRRDPEAYVKRITLGQGMDQLQ